LSGTALVEDGAVALTAEDVAMELFGFNQARGKAINNL